MYASGLVTDLCIKNLFACLKLPYKDFTWVNDLALFDVMDDVISA